MPSIVTLIKLMFFVSYPQTSVLWAPIPQGFSLPQFTFLTEKHINSADVLQTRLKRYSKVLKQINPVELMGIIWKLVPRKTLEH